MPAVLLVLNASPAALEVGAWNLRSLRDFCFGGKSIDYNLLISFRPLRAAVLVIDVYGAKGAFKYNLFNLGLSSSFTCVDSHHYPRVWTTLKRVR